MGIRDSRPLQKELGPKLKAGKVRDADSDLIPTGTDRAAFSELNRLTGKYLPKIASTTGTDRQRRICKLVSRLFDVCVERRMPLVKSLDDLNAFHRELQIHLSMTVMPLLGNIRLSDAEREAIDLAIAGRKRHWLGLVVSRVGQGGREPVELENATDPKPGSDKGDQESAHKNVPGKSVPPKPITKQPTRHRQMVDGYIEEVFRETGQRITRTQIWKAAHYKSRSEFERWERHDKRATARANENIMRVLTEKPHLKPPTKQPK